MKLITDSLLNNVSGQAKENPRLRMNYNFHESMDAPIHRMLNALEPDTYLPPHRHKNPDKEEIYIVLRGSLLAILFDEEGNVTIKGRSKNLLLSASGQNIYPEEIEDKLNNLPYVAESIIVQQNEKLVGLVYPDFDDAFAHGLKNEDIEQIMEENRVALNDMLPAYSQISKMKIYPEEFEKTPKKSIKRYLYQEAKG